MSDLTFRFIGSGNAFAIGGLCWNGFVVNGRYLFEAPPQALMALNRLAIDPNELEAVVLSHHHGDHLLGLPFLFLHWKEMGRRTPVRIIGPRDTEEIARVICDRVAPGIMDAHYGVEWIEARPGGPITAGDLTFEPVEVRHDPKLSQCLGFACVLDGRRFAYTGDSALCEGVLDLARHGEVLIAECSSRAEHHPAHMNFVDDMPTVRAAMGGGATLLLSHLGPGVEEAVAAGSLPNTMAARDFEAYRL